MLNTRKLKLTYYVLRNALRYNLWKALFRKIYSQSKVDVLSYDAECFYNTDLSVDQAMAELSINPYEFNFGESAKKYLEDWEGMNETTSVSDAKPVSVKRKRMGGVANVKFIYAFVRSTEKRRCIEFGVSMGGSTAAILKALQHVENSVLYSNDLPYLWLKEPLKDVGVLIDDDDKGVWSLSIGDDRDNLPKILRSIEAIDFAHYDSDKSYIARERFWNLTLPFMSENCTVIFDDITDNDHFYDLARRLSPDAWKSYVICGDYKKKFGLLQRI